MEIFPSLDAFEAASGRELGPTDWLEIQQDRIDKFADATDDYQWIHVDPVRAADGPFGRTIAHGLLTLALLPHFMEQLYRVDGVSMAINYGLNKVRFLSPVPVGSRVRARMSIGQITPARRCAAGDHDDDDRNRRCRKTSGCHRIRHTIRRVEVTAAVRGPHE